MTYGSWSPFTLEKLMAQKRAKLQKAESVTDEVPASVSPWALSPEKLQKNQSPGPL